MFHVVLYEPEIPDNTGAVGRTCVAVDTKLWLVQPLGFHLDHKRIRRAGLDYWQHLNWELAANYADLQQKIGDRRYWFFTKNAVQSYTEVQYAPEDVFVFGSESQGLPPSVIAANSDHCLRIPMRPEARSLNLSVSVAVVLYEAKRQIR